MISTSCQTLINNINLANDCSIQRKVLKVIKKILQRTVWNQQIEKKGINTCKKLAIMKKL